jgi:hypothetical protein
MVEFQEKKTWVSFNIIYLMIIINRLNYNQTNVGLTPKMILCGFLGRNLNLDKD